MRDEPSQLRDRLEQATAAECPPDATLDAETASLREGWVALGQLLEAAQPGLDEPFEFRQPLRQTTRTRRRLAAVATLAASLMVAVVLAWALMQRGGLGDRASLPQQIALPGAGQTSKPSVALVEEIQGEPHADGTDGFDWSDSLDDQIAMAGQQVVRIQQDWHRLDDAFGPMHRGLEQMEQDIEESEL